MPNQPIFVPTKPRKESVLVFGGEKVGKTTCLLDIASRTDGHLFYLDSDDTLEASIEDFPELEKHMDRFTHYRPFDWNDLRNYGREAATKSSKNDWIVVDRVDPYREMVKDFHIEKIFGKNAATWVMETLKEKRAKGEKGSEHTQIPWSTINSAWYSWVTYLHRKAPAHIFWAANAKQLIEDGMMADQQRLIDMYGNIKRKPGGGNDFGYIPHTILYLSKDPKGVRRLTTIGDRGRKNRFLSAQEMGESFFNSYMIPTAGWRPRKD